MLVYIMNPALVVVHLNGLRRHIIGNNFVIYYRLVDNHVVSTWGSPKCGHVTISAQGYTHSAELSQSFVPEGLSAKSWKVYPSPGYGLKLIFQENLNCKMLTEIRS